MPLLSACSTLTSSARCLRRLDWLSAPSSARKRLSQVLGSPSPAPDVCALLCSHGTFLPRLKSIPRVLALRCPDDPLRGAFAHAVQPPCGFPEWWIFCDLRCHTRQELFKTDLPLCSVVYIDGLCDSGRTAAPRLLWRCPRFAQRRPRCFSELHRPLISFARLRQAQTCTPTPQGPQMPPPRPCWASPRCAAKAASERTHYGDTHGAWDNRGGAGFAVTEIAQDESELAEESKPG